MNKKSFVSILLVICMIFGSMSVFAEPAAEYDRVSLGYTDSVFVKTEVGSTPQQIKVFGITDNAYGEAVTKTDLTGSEGLTYTISDENVASVSSDGYLTIKDYGIATLTVTDGKTTASVLISVTAKGALGGLNSNGEVFTFDGDSFPFESRSNCEKETVNVRRGDGAALIKSDCLDLYCSDRWGTNAGSSGYVEAWFYDPGQLDDGTWAAGTPFGWFDHNDVGAAEGNPNYGWGRADLRLQMHDQIGAMYGNATYKMSKNSTDIKRTKGWHQLVILAYNDGTIDDETRKKPSGNLIGQEQLMNRCRFFIDGQETAMDGFPDGTVFAGCLTIRANGGSGCPVDDIGQYRYIDMKNVNISGNLMEGEALSVSYDYINTYDAVKTENIKWFRGEGDTWAEIEGAAGKTYTLTADDVGKFVRAEIAVTAEDNNSDTYLTEKTTTAKREIITKSAVISPKSIPSISDITVSGNYDINEKLTLSYNFVCEDAQEGNSEIHWQIFKNSAWQNINGATGKSYTVPVEYSGAKLRAAITPVTKDGIVGETAYSGEINIKQRIISKMDIFVSENGDDNNPGTQAAPLKTFARAKEMARIYHNNLNVPVIVNIMGGTYKLTESLSFTELDSGSAEAPITWRAFDGEEVLITGGSKVDNSKITKVTDKAILDRVIDEQAKDKLMQMDISDYVDTIEEIPLFTYYNEDSAYRPTQIYINGTALGYSRWPNNTPGSAWLRINGNITGGSNKTFGYNDDTDRAKLWSDEAFDDLYIDGFINNYFVNEVYKVKSIDKDKKIISQPAGASSAAEDHRFYFFNLIDEIDCPGESYIDRNNKIVYFYPTADMETADVWVSSLQDDLITLSGASYLNFENLKFGYSRGNAFTGENCSNITFDGLTIFNMSGSGVLIDGSGQTNNIFRNSHVYNMGYKGVELGGGSWAPYTKSGNIIENNRIHACGRIYRSYSPAIGGVGMDGEIRNNKLYDSDHMLVNMGTGTQFYNNEVYNAVQQASDMGALYWGRGVYLMGIEVRDNYFHDIGNVYGGYGQQAVFWDDRATGPILTGNVFYRATAQNGNTSTSFAVKTNGGVYSQIENNIFVDNPVAVFFQYASGEGFEFPKQGYWWLWAMGYKGEEADNSMMNWYHINNGTITADSWKERYKDTLWSPIIDGTVFPKDVSAEVGRLRSQGKTAEIIELAKKYAPDNTNIYQNNILVNIIQGNSGHVGYAQPKNIYRGDTSIFKDYGKDFSLTDSALKTVNESISFKNVDMSKMGLKTNIGGSEPVVSDVKITGNNRKGGTIRVEYKYEDADGDSEGISEYAWYTVNSKGVKTPLGKFDSNLLLSEELVGQKVCVTVIPHDRSGLYGEEYTSAPIEISGESAADKTALWVQIDKAEELIKNAVIGAGDGQYPQSAVDNLKAAVEAAKGVSETDGVYQYEINDAEKALKLAIDVFESEKISLLEYLLLNDILKDTENWTVISGGAPEFSNGSMTLKDGASVSYTGAKYRNKIFTFNVKFDKTNDGETVNNAFCFRISNPNSKIWSENSGYLLWIKDETLEYQKWAPSQIIESYPNTSLDAGKVHSVSVGVYDDSDEAVKYILTVDGEKVIEKLVPSANLYGNEGYISFYASNSTMTISPVIVDKSALSEAINEAEKVLEGAVIGTGYGQYPSKADLERALSDAKSVYADSSAVQSDVDRNTLVVNNAVATFLASVSGSGTIDKDTKICYDIPKADLTVPGGISDVSLIAEENRELPEIIVKSPDSELNIPRGTKVGGKFTLPLSGNNAAADIPNSNIKNVYGGASITKTDGLVRIVLKGQGGHRASYFDGSKYVPINTVIREDSFEAAKAGLKSAAVRIKVGDDLVIYIDRLAQIVTYVQSSVQPEEPSVTPGGSGTTKPSNTNKGGSTATGNGGFYSNDTTNPSISNPFTDMAGHWAAADVLAMNKAGIVSGVSDTLFDPDRNITRAEFAAIIARALKLSDKTTDYKDVNDEWFAPYVGACSEAGIISGYDGYFRPNDNITRQEMAVIIVNAYSYLEKAGTNGGIDKFTDKAEIADWAKAAVDTASSVGLISGMGDGTFAPEANATRAQAASIVKRLLDK